jgi:hypothetical protein
MTSLAVAVVADFRSAVSNSPYQVGVVGTVLTI